MKARSTLFWSIVVLTTICIVIAATKAVGETDTPMATRPAQTYTVTEMTPHPDLEHTLKLKVRKNGTLRTETEDAITTDDVKLGSQVTLNETVEEHSDHFNGFVDGPVEPIEHHSNYFTAKLVESK